MVSAYRNRLPLEKPERVIVLMKSRDLKAVDDFGISRGIRSRSSTIRHLIGKALENARNEKAPGHVAKQSPGAFNSNLDQGNYCDDAE